MQNGKGGYKLISLLLVDIELALVGTGATIKGIHESIEASYGKSLQLTGILVNGVEKNDVRVAVEVVDGDYVIKDVYGYDLTIDADDVVIATEHQTGAITRQAIVDATGLVTPLQSPLSDAIVGVGTNNEQKMLGLDRDFEINEDKISIKKFTISKPIYIATLQDIEDNIGSYNGLVLIDFAGSVAKGFLFYSNRGITYFSGVFMTPTGIEIYKTTSGQSSTTLESIKSMILPPKPQDASTKTYIPKLVNGNPQWVEETQSA